MPGERWDKVGELLEEAWKVPPERRKTFLEERCEEEALRQEVLSLLKAEEEAEGFFERLEEAVPPALREAKEDQDTNDRDPETAEGGGTEKEVTGLQHSDPLGLEGKQVGRYEVQEYLGGGGMGIVYRARDPELDRAVALKFLPPHLSRHSEALERFEREAKAAATLDHTHIATIHEIGEAEVTGGKRRFIAMTYYEGETLKEKLEREEPLPMGEASRYATQIAEAIGRAHEAGIVHRDVKPANVMITRRGEVKLLDFGLAKAVAETEITETGRRLGTAAYMSPEQARGEEVGPRADLWALGALLYEMLAGKRPFQGDRDTAILHSILHEKPKPLSEHREVGSELERVVHRCLRKDPDERYSSTEALLEGLGVQYPTAPHISKEAHRTKKQIVGFLWPEWILVVTAATLIVLAVAAGWVLWPRWSSQDSVLGGETSDDSASRSITVLPFEVSGSGAEEWRDGMVTMLSAGLDGAAGLRAIADRTVFATWKKVLGTEENEGATTEGALNVARKIGTRYAVVGSAVALGEELRFLADIHEVSSGRRLGRVQVRGSLHEVTSLTNELARKVLGVLLEKSEDRVPSVNLKSITTESLPALRAFLEGERHLRRGEIGAAIEGFNKATQADSAFALPYARIALLGLWRQEGQGQAMRRAYELSGQLPERERQLIQALYMGRIEHRTLAAVERLRQLTEDYPDDPEVWNNLGEFLFHANVPGGLPEVEEAHKRAVALDPGNAAYYDHYVGPAFQLHHDSTLAAERIEAMPQSTWTKMYRLHLNLLFGNSEQRKQALSRIDTISVPEPWLAFGPLEGPKDRGLLDKILQRLVAREDLSDNPYESFLVINSVHRGQVEQALTDLERLGMRPGTKAYILARLMSLGIPAQSLSARKYLEPENLPTNPPLGRLRATGIYLVENERDEDFDRLVGRIRAMVDTSGEGGPSESVVEAVVHELKGYRAWRAGHLEEAERLWSRSNEMGSVGAIWRGDLYRELGKLEEAEGWYLAAWRHPVAHERMGQLYEKMGDPEKAAAAYHRFIQAWKKADGPLQDRVEKVRGRLQELGSRTTSGSEIEREGSI